MISSQNDALHRLVLEERKRAAHDPIGCGFTTTEQPMGPNVCGSTVIQQICILQLAIAELEDVKVAIHAAP
jgi:hypothetical protein